MEEIIIVENETVRQIGFGKNRMESLSDCIFAFSMTLLVLGVDLTGDINGLTQVQVTGALLDQVPDLIHYIIAFLVIATLWVIHHIQFHKIRYVDHKFLWLNIISLLFVALLPFSTNLVGDFPNFTICAIIFELNLLVASGFFYLQWWYASSDFRLVDPATPGQVIKIGNQRALVIPALSGIGIIFAIAGFEWSSLIYLFAPCTFVIIELYGVPFKATS